METLKKVNENKFFAKDGKVSITIEWNPDGNIILTITVNFFFINFKKEFDLTHLFLKK